VCERDSRENIKLEEEKAILEVLFADTNSKSSVEASDDEDHFEEGVQEQKMFWNSRLAITNTGQ
jgi:hypothetical protein